MGRFMAHFLEFLGRVDKSLMRNALRRNSGTAENYDKKPKTTPRVRGRMPDVG